MSSRAAILHEIGNALSAAGVLLRELAATEQAQEKAGEELVSYAEAARRLDCSTDTVARLVNSKQLAVVRVRRRPKVTVSSIEAYGERRRNA